MYGLVKAINSLERVVLSSDSKLTEEKDIIDLDKTRDYFEWLKRQAPMTAWGLSWDGLVAYHLGWETRAEGNYSTEEDLQQLASKSDIHISRLREFFSAGFSQAGE